MRFQHTLNVPVSCKGVGLHTGGDVSVTILPAPEDHGIVFQKVGNGKEKIRADFKNVAGTSFATTLSQDGAYVATVEHLMSALAGLGVDNALIEVEGDELPIMDGSSAPFACLMQSAGLQEQKKTRKYIQILRPILVSEGDRAAGLYPSSAFDISYSIEFDHPMIKTQRFDAQITPDLFVNDIAWARTFGFLSEMNILKANGFAAGGGLENALVVGNYSVLNKGGLRFHDEFVRHKVLDAIGDLYLGGYPIIGQLVCKKSGHGLNHKLVTRLFEEEDSWRFIELTKNNDVVDFDDETQAVAVAR